jgi:hypothetical protein
MNQPDVILEQQEYKPEEPGEVYVIMKRVKGGDPFGPPDFVQIVPQVDWRNFNNPLDVLNALEIAKSMVIQTIMQQQQAVAQSQAATNPNLQRPGWVKNRN